MIYSTNLGFLFFVLKGGVGSELLPSRSARFPHLPFPLFGGRTFQGIFAKTKSLSPAMSDGAAAADL